MRQSFMLVNDLPKNYAAVEFEQFGPANELHITTRQIENLLPTQLLVRNYATSINPIDFKTRQGLGWAAQQNADKLPMILGYDVAGEVLAKGDSVTDFAVGDKVIGFVGFPLRAGCYAQYVVAAADELVKVTRHTYASAALPLAGLTAYQGLFDIGQLQKGETVLISGASGGVGYLAVQLALNCGAKVIAVASAKNHEKLNALGDIMIIDYKDIKVFEALPSIDLWFDLVGGDSAIEQLTAAKNVTRVVTVPTLSKDKISDAISGNIESVQGMLVSLNNDQLTFLSQAVEKGELRLNIAKYIGYKNAAVAHQLAESGELNGKIVITLD
jgi:NADPH2:quinone reductase